MKEQFARIVSFLFNPLVIGVPVILLIGAGDVGEIRNGPHAHRSPVGVGILCILPLIYIMILLRTGLVQDFHITDRKQRIYLFPFMLVCMVAVLYILWTTEGVSPLVRNMLCVGLFVCLACALITVWFKISLHCAGLSWLAVGLWTTFGTLGGAAGLAGLVLGAWSRLVVKEHRLSEVVAGSLLGLLGTWAGLALMGGN